MKKITFFMAILCSISSISFSVENKRPEGKQSKEKSELIQYFMIKSGDDICSNLGQIYLIMNLAREQPSTFALKFSKNEDERKVWVKSLLDIQKYGYDSASCVAMYYGDIPPKPFITGYHLFVMKKNIYSSSSYADLKVAKEQIENEGSGNENKEVEPEKKEIQEESEKNFRTPTLEATAKSVNFSASLAIVSRDNELLKEWSTTPKSQAPIIPPIGEVKRGETINVLLFFTGCGSIIEICSAVVDYKVLKPDGGLYGDIPSKKVWPQPAQPGIVNLGSGMLRITIDPNDPQGQYEVLATLIEKNTGKVLSLRQSYKVVE